MNKIFILSTLFLTLTACERTDVRTQAANIIYNNCIQNGEDRQWCRCLRADLIDTTKAFTEEMADYIVNGRQHPWFSPTILGAQIRCECRMYPRHVMTYGLSCDGVKPIKF